MTGAAGGSDETSSAGGLAFRAPSRARRACPAASVEGLPTGAVGVDAVGEGGNAAPQPTANQDGKAMRAMVTAARMVNLAEGTAKRRDIQTGSLTSGRSKTTVR